jgi:hypothetical protein
MKTTKEELAAILNGRKYGDEITKEIRAAAKASGLVIIYGASDDNMEFDGAVSEEIGAFNGATAYLNERGAFCGRHEDCECPWCGFDRMKSNSITIEAKWCAPGQPSWTFVTTVAYACFDIMEDDEAFCRGIVIDLAAWIGARP